MLDWFVKQNPEKQEAKMGKLFEKFRFTTPSLFRSVIYATSVLVLVALGFQFADWFGVDGQAGVADSRGGLLSQPAAGLSPTAKRAPSQST